MQSLKRKWNSNNTGCEKLLKKKEINRTDKKNQEQRIQIAEIIIIDLTNIVNSNQKTKIRNAVDSRYSNTAGIGRKHLITDYRYIKSFQILYTNSMRDIEKASQ